MGDRLRRTLPALVGLAVFVAALEVLRAELRAVTWHTLVADILATPPRQLALALLLTAINYAVLTGYDFLAFESIAKRLPPLRVALASFLAYAVANNVGFAALSGASIRYRFYTRWGVSGEDLSRIVFSYSVTFWLGLLALGGISLVMSPLPGERELAVHGLLAPLGWLFILTTCAYLFATAIRRTPIRIGRLELPLPSPGIAVAQLAISALDWALAGAVVYALLPPGHVSYLSLLTAFLGAQLLGLASHVPGGVGVFEGLMVLLLKPLVSAEQLVPALVAYRVIYYLLPLAGALVALLLDELHQRREQAAWLGATLGRFTEQLTPRALAVLTFLAGVVLLFSGATPAAAGRLSRLNRLLPLGVIEASHFLGSVVGAAMLMLSQALARRLDGAYYLTLAGIAVGIGASLMKGADYEEAALLALLLLMLWRVMDQLRRVSDDWLAAKSAAEKGFSLGFFDPEYLSRFPVAVIERDGEIDAFANIWPGPHGVELSVDLMRYRRMAPKGIMEPLFVHLIKWGKDSGYRWFSLGMAPLSGFETSPLAPLWNRIGAFLYEHGEPLYNFQGVRAYKEKFNPEWEPHYLAYPGGLRLPRILADVSALIAGGYRKIFVK